jgi:hypothetical protein
MDNYDLLSITIENEFFKNAIRWPSRGLFQAIRLSVRRPLSDLITNIVRREAIDGECSASFVRVNFQLYAKGHIYIHFKIVV